MISFKKFSDGCKWRYSPGINSTNKCRPITNGGPLGACAEDGCQLYHMITMEKETENESLDKSKN